MPVYPSDLFYSVREIPERSGSPYSATGETTHQRKWRVRTKLKGLAEIAVCTAPGIPRPGAPYVSFDGLEFDLNAFLTRLSATENKSNDDWGDWTVTADYGSRQLTGGHPGIAGSRGHPDSQNNPTLEWPDIEWGSETLEVVRHSDIDGLPFINSAGTVFADAQARAEKISVATLRISRNESSFNFRIAESYSFVVNDRDINFGGNSQYFCKRWSILCMPPTATAKWRGAFQYWRVSYTLKFYPPWVYNADEIGGLVIDPRKKPGDPTIVVGDDEERLNLYLNTWQPLVLDAGTEEYKRRPADSQRGGMYISAKWRTPIYVRNMPVSAPVLLNGEGQQLVQADDQYFPPYYAAFRTYQEQDIGALLDRGVG